LRSKQLRNRLLPTDWAVIVIYGYGFVALFSLSQGVILRWFRGPSEVGPAHVRTGVLSLEAISSRVDAGITWRMTLIQGSGYQDNSIGAFRLLIPLFEAYLCMILETWVRHSTVNCSDMALGPSVSDPPTNVVSPSTPKFGHRLINLGAV
jgi:hypothetical protein